MTENLTYDDLNRLTQSTVVNGPAVGYSYDPAGNILTNSNSGTYNYDTTHGHPYAVASVTNGSTTVYSASYDADGDMTTRNGYLITWTVNNLPSSISSSQGSSTFSYGPDGQRYYQGATDNGVTTDTTYIGSLFEVVASQSTTEYRHNIFADGQVIAVHTIDGSGSATTSYLHYDHLGSVDAITNDQGTIAQQMSFDAFGLRRDPSNWDYDLTSTQIASLKDDTDRGFTFQEQLDNVGLIHMNGRVYDPSIGKFISVDPVEGGNRYAYAYNNPLRYTDPTGYCPPCLSDLTNPTTLLTGIPMPSTTSQTIISNVEQALAHPSIMFEDTSPIVGHYVNNLMARSGTMQEVGGAAAMIVSYWFGPEVYAGYQGYIADINGGTPIEDAEAGAIGYVQAAATLGLAQGAYTAYESGPYGLLQFGLNQYGNMEFRYMAAHYANDHGMSLTQFDLALEGLSAIGNYFYGSDIHQEGNVDYMSGWTSRGDSALPFDIVDTALELQGMPSASGLDYMINYQGTPLVGHSLGALTANNLVSLGAAPSAELYALPILNFATGGTSLTVSWGDEVTGFGFEGLINSGSTIIHGPFGGHSACAVYHVCY